MVAGFIANIDRQYRTQEIATVHAVNQSLSEKDEHIGQLYFERDEALRQAEAARAASKGIFEDAPEDAIWIRQEDLPALLSLTTVSNPEPAVAQSPIPPELAAQLAEARRAGRATVSSTVEPPIIEGRRPVDPETLSQAIAARSNGVLPMSPAPTSPVFAPPIATAPGLSGMDLQSLSQAVARVLASSQSNGYAPPVSPIERAASRFGRW